MNLTCAQKYACLYISRFSHLIILISIRSLEISESDKAVYLYITFFQPVLCLTKYTHHKQPHKRVTRLPDIHPH